MVEKRYMGAQEVAFGRKVRATQRISPSEIFAPEQCSDDDRDRSERLRTAHFLRLRPPKRLLKRAT